ncbi:hypothetical protein OIV83_005860 [Microbotryomycetes sp. JL201]|nr:hypothetical protein OIV83_005860 [Microbotryomycetes sp. JL201]
MQGRVLGCVLLGACIGPGSVKAQVAINKTTSTMTLTRWQQSSLLLTPDDVPTFLVISGKTVTPGQTAASSPAQASSLTLDLSRPIQNLSNTPWVVSDDIGPTASSGAAVAMSSTSAVFFGGDASGDLTVASPLMNDSAWLLTCSASSPPLQSWIHAARNWATQPLRRESVYSASASNGTVSRAWFFGGLRTDKSGVSFNEMWESQINVDVENNDAIEPSTGRWQQWQPSSNDVVPPDMWDGQAVVVPSQKVGEMPSVWIIGGAQLYNGQQERLVSMSNVWVYTPSLDLGQGSWDVVPISGSSPNGRRGLAAVALGNGQIWIQGGRSLDGTQVFGDSAVLDTVKRRWSSASDGPVVWGHSATILGETVLMAFGYGQRNPASSNLVVYAPGNDSFLDAYYPSYETIVPNPKTTDSVSTIMTPTVVIDPTVYPSILVTLQTSVTPISSASAPVQPVAWTTKQKPTGSTNAWVIPGGPTQTGRAGALTDKDTGSSTTSTSTQVVAGAVVGSLLGALAVVAVGMLVVRRRRKQHRYSAYEGSWAKWKSTFPGGRHGDEDDDGKGSLVAGPMYRETVKRSSFYNTDVDDMLEKPLPPPDQSVKGVKAIVAGLFAKSHRRTPSRQHFLGPARDEETVWDDLSVTELNGPEPSLHWTTFGQSSDNLETVSLNQDTIRGRGGRGVWEGYEFGSGSNNADGSVVTDTVKSSNSFLGSALGGFAAMATSADGEDVEDPARALSRIDEEESDDGDRYGSPSVAGRNDSMTALTREASASTHSTMTGVPVRPFSPVKSLYGSTFNSPALMPFMMNRKTSRSSSAGSNDLTGPRNSSWWGRLSRKSTVEVSTTTANEAIRDPTPAPSLDVVAGLSRSATDASDPFSDASATRRREVTGPDDQGQFDPEALRKTGRRAQDASVSSRASSDVTATSSVLEERMRTMDVVQRVRSGSGSMTSVDLTPTLGRNDDGFSRLPETDKDVEMVSCDDVGQVRIVLTPNDELEDPFSDRVSLTRSVSRKRPAPSSDAPSSPSTPSRRLLGPRSLPPPSPVTPAAKRRAPPMTAGTAGVRAMVQQIERRASGSSPASESTPPRPLPSSKSMTFVNEPRSPTKAMTTSRSLVDVDEERRPKVAHKLARKPVLYVANPDVL